MLSHREKQLSAFQFPFAIFTDAAYRVDLREGEYEMLILAGMKGLYEAATSGVPIGSSASTSATAGNTSTTVLAANARRNFATITNTGDTDAYAAFGTAAVAGAGFYLKAGGGTLVIDRTNLFRGAVTAIVSTGDTSLSIGEA